jgi:siroheme synthase-like protein
MAERPYFPLFVDLSATRVLVVGAGKIAARRVQTLLDFAGGITVVAPAVCEAIESLAAAGEITLCRRAFADSDLDGAGLVLAATDDAQLNARIAALCRERGIPVNVGSDKTLCDFYFPGVVRRGSVVVGVTASGTDHATAKRTTEAIRKLLED